MGTGAGPFDIEAMGSRTLGVYGALCGHVLARAHARSGDRVAIASYIGRSDRLDRSLAAFSERYADQTELDHAALVDAIRSGRVSARPGV